MVILVIQEETFMKIEPKFIFLEPYKCIPTSVKDKVKKEYDDFQFDYRCQANVIIL